MGCVKVGVVGVGSWGKNIVRALKELESEGLVKLVGVADANPDLAADVARAHGVTEYVRTVGDLVRLGVEAVAISVPIDRLFHVAKDALSLGLHTFIEKPVSTSSDEVRELMRIAENASLIAQPGFIVRYDPVNNVLKDFITQRRVKYAILKRLSARPTHRRGHSITLDLMIHDIDLALNLVGAQEVRVLSAVGFKMEFGIPQEVHALLTLGKTLVYLVTDGTLPVKVRVAEIVTEDSYCEVSYTDSTVLVRSGEGSYVRRASGEEPLKAELRDFVRSVEGVRSPRAPTLQDALRALTVVELINEKLNRV
ncbi:MAG: Gfo/Idh/MocA family oxidoreductase [Zestosphaera sp.]